MSTLQVSNIHFESTANNRIDYSGSNTLTFYVAGVPVLSANSSGAYYSNLAFNSGGIINWNNSDVLLTHSANALSFSGLSNFDIIQSGFSPELNIGRTDTHGNSAYLSQIDFVGKDSLGANDVYARVVGLCLDHTATAEDGQLRFGVMTNGTFAEELLLEGTALSPVTSDGLALGTTVRQYSDLFLAGTGVINWENGGTTLTHAANVLTLATGGATVTTANSTRFQVNQSLGATGATTLSSTLAAGNTTITGFANVSTTLAVTGAATFSNTVTLPSGTIASNLGRQTIWIPASAMLAVTSPAANNFSAGSTKIPYLAYDASAAEDAWFTVAMPTSWDGGTIYAEVYWMHPATTTNFGTAWQVFGQGYSDNEAINGASFTSLGVITDTGGTTSNLYISPTSSGGAMAGTANEMINFILRREATNGSDTLAVDAYVLGVKILYTVNAGKDG